LAEKKITDRAKKKIISRHQSPVICPGCRKEITEDEDLSKVEYVRTKSSAVCRRRTSDDLRVDAKTLNLAIQIFARLVDSG